MRDGGGGDSGGSRYVSRLQCIKEAVTRHLDHLAAERPNCQVYTTYELIHTEIHKFPTDCYCAV